VKKAAALVAALVALPAAAQVKIGIINSMTGPEAPIGENLTNGYKLAAEDLAAKGVKVQLVWEDDSGQPQKSVAAMEKLAARDGVAGVVGPYRSDCSHAVAKLAERYRTPLVVPAAAKEDITRQGYRFVFRMNAPGDQYGRVLLDAARTLGTPTTVAFLYENTDFGTSTAKAAKEYARSLGLVVVADEPYAKGSPDYRAMLYKVRSERPHLVFMVSYVADAILLMRQARDLGLTPQAFLGGGAGFTTTNFAAERRISQHVLSSTQWTPDVAWPGAREFARRYKERFGKEPSYHAACAYESLRVLAETAAASDGDRDRVRAGLVEGKWSGIMGDVDFADYGGFTNQNRHAMLVQQIVDGGYETVYPPQYATKRAVYPLPGWK
jgi:branched-chain amino acid transport system substrate-binding protein